MNPVADTVLEASTPLHEEQILANPIELFSAHWPDDIETLDAIKSLLQQRLSLEQQQNAAQNETGILSRQIGEAKRNKQATDKLIASMQMLSAKRKTLNKQSKQVNQVILNYFAQQTRTAEQKKTEQNNNASNQRYLSTSVNIGTIHIDVFDIDNMEEWNQYVISHPASSIHHHTKWRHILRQSYGHENLYLCARDSDQHIVGILPLVHIKSRLFGNKLVSMPFFQRGGAIADAPEIEQKLIQAAASYGLQMKVDYAEFRDDIPRGKLPEPCATQTHKVNMVLALPDSEQTLWQGFTAKLRAQIRRPRREPCQVFIGGREYLNDFYAVYSRNMRDLGSPVQSKQFIDNILQQFPQNSWLIVVKLDQRPVAAGFLLGFKDTLEIPLASTIKDVNPLSINMLLYWEVLKFAVDKHYRYFDFGRSSLNSGTFRFKKQWGAIPKRLYWHYWLSENTKLPELNPNNPKYALVINIWKRLPIFITKSLGPLIVRNLP